MWSFKSDSNRKIAEHLIHLKVFSCIASGSRIMRLRLGMSLGMTLFFFEKYHLRIIGSEAKEYPFFMILIRMNMQKLDIDISV